jgi:hypothetical protein
MPVDIQFIIPDFFRYLLFVCGIFISFIGVMFLHMRMRKTGIIHFLPPGNPRRIIWLYVRKNGDIDIFPSVRKAEGQLYEKEVDGQVKDIKSYRMHDHPVRIVAESIAHTIDLDYVLYVNLLEDKHGLKSLSSAREYVKKMVEEEQNG